MHYASSVKYFLDNCKLPNVVSGIANAAQHELLKMSPRLSGICNAAIKNIEILIYCRLFKVFFPEMHSRQL